jgi:hypothetical protein
MSTSTEQIAQQLHNVLPEFLEGYLVLGTNPLTGEPVARFWAPSKESEERLNLMVRLIAESGGVRMERVEVEA